MRCKLTSRLSEIGICVTFILCMLSKFVLAQDTKSQIADNVDVELITNGPPIMAFEGAVIEKIRSFKFPNAPKISMVVQYSAQRLLDEEPMTIRKWPDNAERKVISSQHDVCWRILRLKNESEIMYYAYFYLPEEWLLSNDLLSCIDAIDADLNGEGT